MNYNSLNDYLDQHLGANPSDDEIRDCKRAYWKWYRSSHRKKRVSEAKALNLTISLTLWNELKTRATAKGIDVYDYIKQHLKNGVETTLETDHALAIELMQCTESIKDCMNGDISIETLYHILQQILLKL